MIWPIARNDDYVGLGDGVCRIGTNEALGIEDGVLWIPSHWIFGSIPEKKFTASEINV